MISIIITSQKYKTLPTAVRSACSMVVIFRLAPIEIKMISDELVYGNLNYEQVVENEFLKDKKFIMYNIMSGVLYSEFDRIN